MNRTLKLYAKAIGLLAVFAVPTILAALDEVSLAFATLTAIVVLLATRPR